MPGKSRIRRSRARRASQSSAAPGKLNRPKGKLKVARGKPAPCKGERKQVDEKSPCSPDSSKRYRTVCDDDGCRRVVVSSSKNSEPISKREFRTEKVFCGQSMRELNREYANTAREIMTRFVRRRDELAVQQRQFKHSGIGRADLNAFDKAEMKECNDVSKKMMRAMKAGKGPLFAVMVCAKHTNDPDLARRVRRDFILSFMRDIERVGEATDIKPSIAAEARMVTIRMQTLFDELRTKNWEWQSLREMVRVLHKHFWSKIVCVAGKHTNLDANDTSGYLEELSLQLKYLSNTIAKTSSEDATERGEGGDGEGGDGDSDSS
jgi:hypothetical protein